MKTLPTPLSPPHANTDLLLQGQVGCVKTVSPAHAVTASSSFYQIVPRGSLRSPGEDAGETGGQWELGGLLLPAQLLTHLNWLGGKVSGLCLVFDKSNQVQVQLGVYKFKESSQSFSAHHYNLSAFRLVMKTEHQEEGKSIGRRCSQQCDW